MKGMKMNKALLPLLLCCFIFPASGKDAGWQWYNEKINPKEKEKFTRKQTDLLINEITNLSIASSYLTDEESELLSRFYVLNKQDKERLLQIARTFTEN